MGDDLPNVPEEFWGATRPGARFSDSERGTQKFFEEVESHRYDLEEHIPGIVRFERWANRDVLEVGCGLGTDGLRFARAGARYTGYDLAEDTIEFAKQNFVRDGQTGNFARGSADELPSPDASFDLVYSHGVIHHIERTEQAVSEFYRVLRPGGTALVMLYHRTSLNYYV